MPNPQPIPTADLMKKGLRLTSDALMTAVKHSNRRPDEEGIKTLRGSRGPWPTSIPTADLMKKGLRLVLPKEVLDHSDIPTADLMKKGLRHSFHRGVQGRSIPTADLMKKGLRRRGHGFVSSGKNSNRRPDEEGIKTQAPGDVPGLQEFQPQT